MVDYLHDHAHIRARTDPMDTMLRVRDAALRSLHAYFEVRSSSLPTVFASPALPDFMLPAAFHAANISFADPAENRLKDFDTLTRPF